MLLEVRPLIRCPEGRKVGEVVLRIEPGETIVLLGDVCECGHTREQHTCKPYCFHFACYVYPCLCPEFRPKQNGEKPMNDTETKAITVIRDLLLRTKSVEDEEVANLAAVMIVGLLKNAGIALVPEDDGK